MEMAHCMPIAATASAKRSQAERGTAPPNQTPMSASRLRLIRLRKAPEPRSHRNQGIAGDVQKQSEKEVESESGPDTLAQILRKQILPVRDLMAIL